MECAICKNSNGEKLTLINNKEGIDGKICSNCSLYSRLFCGYCGNVHLSDALIYALDGTKNCEDCTLKKSSKCKNCELVAVCYCSCGNY